MAKDPKFPIRPDTLVTLHAGTEFTVIEMREFFADNEGLDEAAIIADLERTGEHVGGGGAGITYRLSFISEGIQRLPVEAVKAMASKSFLGGINVDVILPLSFRGQRELERRAGAVSRLMAAVG